MAKDPAYPMYAQDFDMDTADWGIDEIGVYIRLLNYEWINGHIPSDHTRIAKIARISPRKLQKIWEIISKKFSRNGDNNLHNKRMEEERAKRIKYIESQRNSGKRGAEKRWKGHSKPIGDPIGKPNGENMALHSHIHSQSSKYIKKKVKKKKSPPKKPKQKHLDYVLLTEAEKAKLDSKFGSNVNPMIECLNNYIGSSGKNYKSHYFALLGWVADKFSDSNDNPSGSQPPCYTLLKKEE